MFARPAAWCFGRLSWILVGTLWSCAFCQAVQVRGRADQSVGQRAAAGPLDLNFASAAELRALPGMGDVYVKRILEGRPYTAKNQLMTRGILPQKAYERIRDFVVAHRPPKVS